MLRRLPPALVAVAMLVLALAVVPGAAVAADLDPTPIDCAAQPWRAECHDGPPAEDNQGGGERACSHLGEPVPCNHPDYGWWLGDHVDDYGRARLLPGIGEFISEVPDGAVIEGCWAQRSINQPPPPTTGPEPDPEGAWYNLYCLRGRPYSALLSGQLAEPQLVIGVWLDPGAASPDPETLARRAIASLNLRGPEIRTSPPGTGSLPLGMPVWLSTVETTETWGPNPSGAVCDRGLCVWITARATHIDWRMGDSGAPIRCERDQNVPWHRGMDFLRPGNSCHHYYPEPSYDQPDGRYQLIATTTFRVDWAGGGQSGSFDDVTSACGPAGGDPCQSTTTVRVVELHVLMRR